MFPRPVFLPPFPGDCVDECVQIVGSAATIMNLPYRMAVLFLSVGQAFFDPKVIIDQLAISSAVDVRPAKSDPICSVVSLYIHGINADTHEQA